MTKLLKTVIELVKDLRDVIERQAVALERLADAAEGAKHQLTEHLEKVEERECPSEFAKQWDTATRHRQG